MAFMAMVGCYQKASPMPKEAPIVFDTKQAVYSHFTKVPVEHRHEDLQTILPKGIEELCFPDAEVWLPHSPDFTGTYNLILTHSDGIRSLGLCQRIAPEGDNLCLPLAVCVLSQHSGGVGSKVRSVLVELVAILAKSLGRGVESSKCSTLVQSLLNLDGPSLEAYVREQAHGPVSCWDSAKIQHRLGRNGFHSKSQSGDDFGRPLGLISTLMSIDHLLLTLAATLQEKRIVVLSQRLGHLSCLFDGLEDLLRPFVWQHVLVPILPRSKWTLLEAPTPFLVGVLVESNPGVKGNLWPGVELLRDWNHVLEPRLAPDKDCLVIALGDGESDRGSIVFKRPQTSSDLPLPRPLLRDLHRELSIRAWKGSSGQEKYLILRTSIFKFFHQAIVCGTDLKLCIQEDGESQRSQSHSQSGRGSQFQRPNGTLFNVDAFLIQHQDSECYEFLQSFVGTALFGDFIRRACHLSSCIDLPPVSSSSQTASMNLEMSSNQQK
eukprot:maker-scaffold809_size94238-snap-gene-0.31 protein:Tk02715 transcript:maker-scaffold809_size94238-snap-gene-0.31-mRNA-1 annotation:"st5 protein"